MKKKEIAAELMKHLVEHNYHGYSQYSRFGDGTGKCTVTVDGKQYKIEQGDRDCSSAVITAYEAAGVTCGGATYTGNMKKLMTATGNFKWHTMESGYIAKKGDVYLNEANHTAMCWTDTPDTLMEFSISERGTIDGQEGDQTGQESRTRNYYDYPWDGILECVCDRTGATTEQRNNTGAKSAKQPKYRVRTEKHGWLEWMEGFKCTCGNCSDDYAGVAGVPITGFEAKEIGKGGWWQITTENLGTLGRNQQAPEGSGYITAITVYYATENPEDTGWMKAKYRTSGIGQEYKKWEYDDEDDYSGDKRTPIDRVQLTLEKII